jgi:hypothetical protein
LKFPQKISGATKHNHLEDRMISNTFYYNDSIDTDLWISLNDVSLVSLEDVDEYPLIETINKNHVPQDVAGMFFLEDGPSRPKNHVAVEEDIISEAIRPTPIGPAHAVTVVDEVPLMHVATSSRGNPPLSALLDCLRPLLLAGRRGFQEKRSKLSFHKTFESSSGKRGIFHLQANHEKLLTSNKRRKLVRDHAFVKADPSSDSWDCSSACASSASSFPDKEKSDPVKIRAHQSTQWNERYLELVEYQKQYGHCVVPYHYKQNAKLALWVKRQRHQYKLKTEGQHSTMSDDREAALELLGFVWDSHKAVWEERINELVAYREKLGHCNVPAKFAENSQLAIWVKCQRRQYKLFCASERSNMTEARIKKLSEAGFVWDPRSKF